jgi:competence protein ComEC
LKGLNFIASQFSIGQFWDNGVEVPSEPYLQVRETLRQRKIKIQSLDEESPSQIIHGVQVSILNPPAWGPMQRKSLPRWNLNNSSLVIKLRFKNVSVLLAGDIENEAEGLMLRKGYPLGAEMIKVPHHGSSSSSSPLFLEKVKPAYAILSVGERNIGRLPHPDVLKRYEQLGSKIFRTDKHGAITVVTDGKEIEVKTFLKGRS